MWPWYLDTSIKEDTQKWPISTRKDAQHHWSSEKVSNGLTGHHCSPTRKTKIFKKPKHRCPQQLHSSTVVTTPSVGGGQSWCGMSTLGALLVAPQPHQQLIFSVFECELTGKLFLQWGYISIMLPLLKINTPPTPNSITALLLLLQYWFGCLWNFV